MHVEFAYFYINDINYYWILEIEKLNKNGTVQSNSVSIPWFFREGSIGPRLYRPRQLMGPVPN